MHARTLRRRRRNFCIFMCSFYYSIYAIKPSYASYERFTSAKQKITKQIAPELADALVQLAKLNRNASDDCQPSIANGK